jgi:hypothetical protein
MSSFIFVFGFIYTYLDSPIIQGVQGRYFIYDSIIFLNLITIKYLISYQIKFLKIFNYLFHDHDTFLTLSTFMIYTWHSFQ